jgi:nucleoside-diphosphate-sugar epimerase
MNIGSEEMVCVNELAAMIMKIADKGLEIRHVPGPVGVRGRTSDNRHIREQLGWSPAKLLRAGLAATCHWIREQVETAEVVCGD